MGRSAVHGGGSVVPLARTLFLRILLNLLCVSLTIWSYGNYCSVWQKHWGPVYFFSYLPLCSCNFLYPLNRTTPKQGGQPSSTLGCDAGISFRFSLIAFGTLDALFSLWWSTDSRFLSLYNSLYAATFGIQRHFKEWGRRVLMWPHILVTFIGRHIKVILRKHQSLIEWLMVVHKNNSISNPIVAWSIECIRKKNKATVHS